MKKNIGEKHRLCKKRYELGRIFPNEFLYKSSKMIIIIE